MTYYQLCCTTCKETLKRLCATEPGELLDPDYEACENTAGWQNMEALQLFHDKRAGHGLVTVAYEGDVLKIVPQY